MKIACLFLLGIVSYAFSVEFYVARDGNDTNPGTSDAPFSSLERARDAIRELKAKGGLKGDVTVIVRKGEYVLPNTLALGKEDSGSESTPIVYRAAANETVILLGGKPIAGFVPHQGQIVKADLAKQGFTDARIRVVVFNGKRQELARYPNGNPEDLNGGNWAYVDGKRVGMYNQMPEDEDDYYKTHMHLDFWQRNLPRLTRTLKMKAEDARSWQQAQDGEISIFPRFNWWHYVISVESFDAESHTLNLGPGCFYEIRPGDRYFVRGIKEELDAPGEWYYDRKAQTLYFWPPEAIGDKAVYASTLKHILSMEGCKNVEFRGFTFECSEGTGVQLKDCTGCKISAGTIRNVGDAMDLKENSIYFQGSGVTVLGGSNNGIIGNDIYDTGSYGIFLGGGSGILGEEFFDESKKDDTDTLDLTLGGNYAENNVIHHVGLVDRKAKGIELIGAGNRVSHNLIYHIPQSGIYAWGSKHTIEYNHIHHTCLEAEDTGAIGGGNIDWLSWHGLAIRYNYIHDTIGFGFNEETGTWSSPHFTWALYPDWATTGAEIVGNILVRAPRELIHLHCGRGNRIENNILIDGGDGQIYWSGWTTATGFWSTMVDGWTKNYQRAIRSEAWRQVPTLVDPATVPLPDGQLMYDNVFSRNIVYYRKPSAMLYHLRQLPLDRNPFDRNLIYHFDKPLLTGQIELKETKGDNLLPNPGLEDGLVGQPPKDWPAVDTAGGKVRVEVVEEQPHSGGRSLRIDPGVQLPEHKVVRLLYFPLSPVPYTPGKAFLLEGWIKTEKQTPATVEIFSYTWKVMKTISADGTWRRFEFVFRVPNEGGMHFEPGKTTFNAMLVFKAGTGPFLLDDVCLREAVISDEWETWLAMGQDKNSIIADPLFVDPAKDDYRLKPDSPAFKLGFKPIPFDKIGPYADERRATWPIVEVPVARESMSLKSK
jgi:hypothetical protein